jgi:hypothetical protein
VRRPAPAGEGLRLGAGHKKEPAPGRRAAAAAPEKKIRPSSSTRWSRRRALPDPFSRRRWSLDVSVGDHPVAAVDGEEQGLKDKAWPMRSRSSRGTGDPIDGAPFPRWSSGFSDDIQWRRIWATPSSRSRATSWTPFSDAQEGEGQGALESNEHRRSRRRSSKRKTVIVVESANPEVVYVPTYSPTVVYGPPVYPYPPIYYPPYPPGAAFVSSPSA